MITRGQKINDRYEIIRTIGEGGMANVYLAHDLILDRDVAVKILRGDLSGDDKFVRRFQREATAASSLSHPNIVEMYDVGDDNGIYFIVMEYIEGKTLKSLIKKRGKLTLSETIDIMLQLTSGIACAHESYIIHRDIKPQNVIIMDNGQVKITDFGIASSLNSNELTQTNSVMGSVHYLPPEQANGNGATIKSDIYSLGILMYELLVGKVPFRGENPVEIAIKQMREPIPSVCEENSDIPQSVENIILKATAKNPKNRYDTVDEMHRDLVEALSKEKRDEPRLVFKYPEHEMDSKTITRSEKMEEERREEKEEKNDKKINKFFLITACVALFIGIIAIVFFLVIPNIGGVPEIEIPDVSNMSVSKAEKKLEKAGFVVSDDVSEKDSDEIEEGKVISTSPKIGRTVKKGSTVKLIVSSGISGYEIQNYVGENYLSVKATLEANGIIVDVEYEEHTEEDELSKNEILKQDVKPGTELKDGSKIVITIPKIIVRYPDFTEYTLSEVNSFCKKNGCTVEKKEIETSSYDEGTILSQNPNSGTNVSEGDVVTITVTKLPPVTIEVPSDDDKSTDDTEEDKKTTDNSTTTTTKTEGND